MIRHTVMFKWNEDIDAAHIAVVAEALDGLPTAVPEVRAYHHGADIGVNEGNYDYVVVADFDDTEGYLAYRDAPAHVDFVQSMLVGRISDRAAVQYEFDA